MNADKSTPSGSRSIRADILRLLRLPADASEEQLYRKFLAGPDLTATGTAGPQDAQRINSMKEPMASCNVVGLGLAREARKLLNSGAARDMREAQTMALAANPRLGRV